MTHLLCFVCSLRGASHLSYMTFIIQWLLVVFLVIFSASLSGSNAFVLMDSLDGNGALFANVLCDIPVLHINSNLWMET